MPSVGKQKFLIEAGLTPLSHVTDIASGLKALTSPVITLALRAVFRPPTGNSPLESPKAKPIRASYSTFQTENNSSIIELQRLKERLDSERATLLGRLGQLQGEARRNYLQGKEASSEVLPGFSLLHLAIALVLGLWIGAWLRS